MATKKFDRRSQADVTLEFPVDVDGVSYTKLTMRRPKTADTMAAAKQKGSEHERGVFLLARLCDVSPNVIEELDEIDSDALGEQLNAFTGRQSDR